MRFMFCELKGFRSYIKGVVLAPPFCGEGSFRVTRDLSERKATKFHWDLTGIPLGFICFICVGSRVVKWIAKNCAIWFWKLDRNFATNTIWFSAHFTTLVGRIEIWIRIKNLFLFFIWKVIFIDVYSVIHDNVVFIVAHSFDFVVKQVH